MNRSPDRLNFDHLKKQAKDLIRLYRNRDAAAIARFRLALPAAARLTDGEISALGLHLHDAQSCLAREHGFKSRADLKRYVEVQTDSQPERAARVLSWLGLIYPGEVSGTVNRANPRVALRMIAGSPDLVAATPIFRAPSAMRTRCGRPRKPIRHGSTGRAGRCNYRRSSPLCIRAC